MRPLPLFFCPFRAFSRSKFAVFMISDPSFLLQEPEVVPRLPQQPLHLKKGPKSQKLGPAGKSQARGAPIPLKKGENSAEEPHMGQKLASTFSENLKLKLRNQES